MLSQIDPDDSDAIWADLRCHRDHETYDPWTGEIYTEVLKATIRNIQNYNKFLRDVSSSLNIMDSYNLAQ